MELNKALEIAAEVIEKLSPHCDLINIAGSCRREKPEVKDIEVVALPSVVVGKDLFGGDTEPDRKKEFVTTVMTFGKVIKGNPYGKMMQIQLPQGIMLDLFMPDDFDYYRNYVVRTGSAEWVARFIAGGWRKIGWVGSDQGLRLQSQCKGEKSLDDKMHWKCVIPKSQQMTPPHWKSEEEFFEWIKIKWVEPKFRNVN